MSQDESAKPPQEPNKIILVFLSVIFIGVLALNLPKSKAAFENLEITELSFIQENTLIGISNPYYTNPNKIELYGIEIPYLLYKIIECESNFDPLVINQKYGSSSGIGLGQLTAIAIADCENNLNKKIDPYVPQENLECCLWLYDKYGTAPWGTKETDGIWGSWSCWNKYLDN